MIFSRKEVFGLAFSIFLPCLEAFYVSFFALPACKTLNAFYGLAVLASFFQTVKLFFKSFKGLMQTLLFDLVQICKGALPKRYIDDSL